MGNKDIFTENAEKNKPFINAFDWLAKQLRYNQMSMANHIGIKSTYVSNFRKGRKLVSKDIKQKLAKAFSDYGRTIYMPYLDGKSQVMLRENVTDEQIAQNLEMESNPDYQLMQERKTEQHNSIDQSSLVNAIIASHDKAIAAKDETISALREELSAKQQTIDTQADLITTLRHEIAALQSKIAAMSDTDLLSSYPFKTGVAENPAKKTRPHK